MIVPVMAISNLVLTQQIYFEETNGAHAYNRDRVPLRRNVNQDDISTTGNEKKNGVQNEPPAVTQYARVNQNHLGGKTR